MTLLEQEIILCECAVSEQNVKHTISLITITVTVLGKCDARASWTQFVMVHERWLDPFLPPHSPT